ncbi:prepilin peptidase [Burkholderia stagnalis]|uniref:prepilin peptidase n=1 Tax=Burkholderia stagnalis TaxID=1503054 RepID=UPI000F571D6E|nr:A24 family peptidase [Burkholderia stagnalis]RQR11285.1 prepilin peptidase [Burkholderia stagnalis]RQR20313.1 prepilin peptidase [Burkholderia stagnalis]
MSSPWIPTALCFSAGLAASPPIRVLARWLPDRLIADATGQELPIWQDRWRNEAQIGLLGIGLGTAFGGVALLTGTHVPLFAWALFTSFSLLLAMIDHHSQLLPDMLTWPLLLLGLVANMFNCFVPPTVALAGAIAGYSTLWIANLYFQAVRGKTVLCPGDCKYMGAVGAWVGITHLPAVFILAAIALPAYRMLPSRLRPADGMLSFGPALSVAAVACVTGILLSTSR